MFGIGRKIHRAVMGNNAVDVSEVDGVRSLYLGSSTIQSSMRVKEPFALALPYSKGMMGFLMLAPQAKQVLSIGLGGGSVPKYIWKNCPELAQIIVEINPQVIQVASTHFFMPENDARLQVIAGDGIAYLQAHIASADVLMIDAFDGLGIPPDFCTQAFFDDCESALTHSGLFVINLWGSDKNFDVYLQRIEQSFNQQVLMLPTGKPGNIVVFGFKAGLPLPRIARLRERASQLMHSHNSIDFLDLVHRLTEHNPHQGLEFTLRH